MIGNKVHDEPRQSPRDAILDLESGDKSPHSKNRLWRYGPVIVWAALIFTFSTGLLSGSNTSTVVRPLVQWIYPGISEATLGLVHGLIRKASHFVEYAILAVLLARAFRTSSRDLLRRHWFLVSLLLVAAYSLTDEFHQSFVASRTASIYDCLIDTAGGLTALLILRVKSRRVREGSLTPSPFGRGTA